MAGVLPRQGRPCTVYVWCTGHPRSSREHHGETRVVRGRGGRELRMALVAVGEEAPYVTVELLLVPGAPALEVVDLEHEAVLQAAAALRRLALEQRGARDQPAGATDDSSA